LSTIPEIAKFQLQKISGIAKFEAPKLPNFRPKNSRFQEKLYSLTPGLKEYNFPGG